MTRTDRRGKAGWWVLAVVGGILTAAGIRYASSTDWWANFFNRDRQTYQTVNTGASVQVAASTTTSVPATVLPARPIPDNSNSISETQRQERRMW